MNNFVKAFFSFGLATSIEKLLGFIILPIYTKYFNTTEYGIIDMIGTVLQIGCIFGLLQLETSLQRYYHEYNNLKKKLLITTVYFLILISSLLIGILIFVFSDFLSIKLFQSSNYSILIRTISIQLPLANISMLGLLLLRYKNENKKFLTVIVSKVAFSLIFVFLFVVCFKLGLRGVFLAQVCALVFSTSLVTYYVRHSFVLRLSKVISKKNFLYALPQFPARIGSVVLAQANRFFMLSFLSLGAIGIYSVSLKLASSIQLVNTAFIMAWAPFMHEQFKNKNNKKVFASTFPLVVGITLLMVSLISLYATEMINMLATPEYKSGSKYVGGLAFFFAFYIIKETVDIGPKIKEKTKYLSLTFSLSVLVNVVSLYFLIQYLEIYGVVISMMITNFFLVICSWYVSNRLYHIPFSIIKFINYLAPTLLIIFLTMHFDLTLNIRILISLVGIGYYGIFIYFDFIKIKTILE